MRWFRRPMVLGLVLLASPAAAQPVFSPGTRVRVLVADSAANHARDATQGWVIGSVVSSPPPALLLDAKTGRVSYTVGELRQIDVTRGRANKRWMGATIGGLLSGAAFTGAVCGFSSGSCNIGANVGGFLVYYATGAIPGVIVGGAMGARHVGEERWEQAWPAR